MPEERAPCRDFERGVCARGDECMYLHQEGTQPVDGADGGKLSICKDFQNIGCERRKCKFLHITKEEEAVYNSTGQLPEHGGRPEATVRAPSFMGKDVCKDFLNGRCDRGPRCRFMHPPEEEFRGGDMCGGGMGGGMYGKRSRVDPFFAGGGGGGGGGMNNNDGAIMEENELLRRKITDLQREILSLREMNDTLYDQNARYISQLQKAGTVPAASPQVLNSNPVVYPQLGQAAAYPTKVAVVQTGTAATTGVGAYSYLHY